MKDCFNTEGGTWNDSKNNTDIPDWFAWLFRVTDWNQLFAAANCVGAIGGAGSWRYAGRDYDGGDTGAGNDWSYFSRSI